jgi:DNA-directed RNA polymerase specialized sigma24 family protein
MDYVHVEAPVGTTAGTPLERAFASDFPILLNYIARLTDRIDEAGGIACETFREVAERRGHPSEGLRAELFRVATQRCRDLIRPRRWFGRRAGGTLLLEGFPDADARKALRRDTVQRALAALGFEERATVLLRDSVHLSYADMSYILGVPERKLVHALDRGRAELSEIYDYIKF